MGSAMFLVVAVQRWSNLKAGASDLGIFDQAIWLMSRGHAPFVTTIGIDVFADHVSAVLLLFVPLYRLVATPLWLLVAQSVCLGITVVPARRLADSLQVGRGWATLFVLANPFIWSAAIYDMHPVVLATPAVAWLLLAVRRNDRLAATIAAILIALCRADTVVVLAGAAILAEKPTRRRLLLLVPIPLIAAQAVPHLLGTWQTFERYYGTLGDSPIDALTHPWRVGLLVPTAAVQLAGWLLPVGFLPLRRLRWVAALAVGGLPLLLSSWPGIAEPWWHHGAVMVPFVIGGALAALSPLPNRRRGDATPREVDSTQVDGAHADSTQVDGAHADSAHADRTRIDRTRIDRVRIAIGTVAALVLAGPLAPWAPPRVRVPDVLRPAAPAVERAIAEVGPHESVSTSNDAAARLAHRGNVYIFPCPFPDAPGSRTCSHPNLYRRAGRVDVVVLPGEVDLSWLPGRWRVRHVDGVTIARRAP